MQKFFANMGGNRVVMALSIARLGDAIGNSILFIVIPLYVAHLPSPIFALPETVRVGILIGLFGLVNAVLQPIMGAWSDHAGKRKLLIEAGLGLMVLSSLGFVLANQFYHLLLLRALQGIGVAMTVPAAVALIAASSHPKTRGGSMGIYTAFRMAGLAVGPLLGGYLFDWLWRCHGSLVGLGSSCWGSCWCRCGSMTSPWTAKSVPVRRNAHSPSSVEIFYPPEF